MGLTLTTAPTEAEILALVSVADMKAELRIAYTKEDDYLKEKIFEAYAWFDGVDGWLNRSILTQRWTLTQPGFTKRQYYTTSASTPAWRWVPTDVIEIPYPPLRSIVSVNYVIGGVSTPLPSSSYKVDTSGLLGTITRNGAWPSIDSGSDISIVFEAGYGDAAAVKAKARGIVSAIKLLAADYFRNREDTYAEPRLVAVNRKIMNGVQFRAGRYRIMNRYA